MQQNERKNTKSRRVKIKEDPRKEDPFYYVLCLWNLE